LLTVQRLLASQQNETRKLNEQVGNVTTTLDNLRQSFATASAAEAEQPAARPAARRTRARAAVTRPRPKAVATQRKRTNAKS
jgi:phage-related tail protein